MDDELTDIYLKKTDDGYRVTIHTTDGLVSKDFITLEGLSQWLGCWLDENKPYRKLWED